MSTADWAGSRLCCGLPVLLLSVNTGAVRIVRIDLVGTAKETVTFISRNQSGQSITFLTLTVPILPWAM